MKAKISKRNPRGKIKIKGLKTKPLRVTINVKKLSWV